jgi:hypothetical protein
MKFRTFCAMASLPLRASSWMHLTTGWTGPRNEHPTPIPRLLQDLARA